jgi:hypothetical protein
MLRICWTHYSASSVLENKEIEQTQNTMDW